MVLFIKNISVEGPGILEPYFRGRGYRTNILDLEKGDGLPRDLSGIQAVACLGGPMNVYEEEKYTYLKDEAAFIRSIVENRIPFMGICLGAQLLAKSCGARVRKADNEEIGFYEITLSPEGEEDIMFSGMESPVSVFQWHGDTFDIPDRGILLAGSELCANQAFKIGHNAYGFQFHLEVDKPVIEEWLAEYWDRADPVMKIRSRDILSEYRDIKNKFILNGQNFCRNFESLIK
ncbi:MAG: type 1 glutamine amidotransferase [Candidatus Omnitrophota bacterium]